MIHPTAIIDSNAHVDINVEIGPYSIIKKNSVIGSGSQIGPHVIVDENVTLGTDCKVFQYASIGGAPQDLKFRGEETYLKIGNGTVIREFATLNRGTGSGGGVTEVGEENFLMAYSHIAHDCKTGRKVILANNSTLAGHVEIGDNVTLGGLVAVHQFVQIGDYSYVGGKSAVTKDIPPYVIVAGDRARLFGLNKVGLRRHHFSESTLKSLKRAYRIVFRIGLTLNEAVDRVRAEVDQIPEVMNFIDFIKSSNRGITR